MDKSQKHQAKEIQTVYTVQLHIYETSEKTNLIYSDRK